MVTAHPSDAGRWHGQGQRRSRSPSRRMPPRHLESCRTGTTVQELERLHRVTTLCTKSGQRQSARVRTLILGQAQVESEKLRRGRMKVRFRCPYHASRKGGCTNPATAPIPVENKDERPDADDRPTQVTRQTCRHGRHQMLDVRSTTSVRLIP